MWLLQQTETKILKLFFLCQEESILKLVARYALLNVVGSRSSNYFLFENMVIELCVSSLEKRFCLLLNSVGNQVLRGRRRIRRWSAQTLTFGPSVLEPKLNVFVLQFGEFLTVGQFV